MIKGMKKYSKIIFKTIQSLKRKGTNFSAFSPFMSASTEERSP